MKYILTLFCILCLSACGTISPDFTKANEIKFGSDGIQDAGIKGQVVNVKTGIHMILLSSSERDIYNNDIVKHGTFFNPPITKDFGVIAYHNLYALRNDALVDFVVMEKLEGRDLALKK